MHGTSARGSREHKKRPLSTMERWLSQSRHCCCVCFDGDGQKSFQKPKSVQKVKILAWTVTYFVRKHFVSMVDNCSEQNKNEAIVKICMWSVEAGLILIQMAP